MVSRVLPRAVEIKAAWGGGEGTGHAGHIDDTDHDHDEEDDMATSELVGFFTCPAAGGTVCAVYRGGYKVHQDGSVLASAQALARLGGVDDAIKPINDVAIWQALGPLLIPSPGWTSTAARPHRRHSPLGPPRPGVSSDGAPRRGRGGRRGWRGRRRPRGRPPAPPPAPPASAGTGTSTSHPWLRA